jgi:hypothetical protein
MIYSTRKDIRCGFKQQEPNYNCANLFSAMWFMLLIIELSSVSQWFFRS